MDVQLVVGYAFVVVVWFALPAAAGLGAVALTVMSVISARGER